MEPYKTTELFQRVVTELRSESVSSPADLAPLVTTILRDLAEGGSNVSGQLLDFYAELEKTTDADLRRVMEEAEQAYIPDYCIGVGLQCQRVYVSCQMLHVTVAMDILGPRVLNEPGLSSMGSCSAYSPEI